MFSKRIARTLGGLGSEVMDGMRGSVLRTISRDFSGGRKTVLITGASRGIGYAITKLITNTLDSPMVYGTSRNSAEQLTDLIRCVRHNIHPLILSNSVNVSEKRSMQGRRSVWNSKTWRLATRQESWG